MELVLLAVVVVAVIGYAISRHNAEVERQRTIYQPGPPTPVEAQPTDFFGLPFEERQLGETGPDLDRPPFDPRPRRRTISMAIRKEWDIEIVYCDTHGEWSSRVVTPEWLGGAQSGYQLGEKGYNKDLFGGYCHLRQEERTFRLDRVRAIEVVTDSKRDRAMYNVL